MAKLSLGAEVHRLMPKLFRAEVTRGEHRLPRPNGWTPNPNEPDPNNKIIKFGRVLSCLLLLSLQSLDQDNIEKTNLGLISITIAGSRLDITFCCSFSLSILNPTDF